MSSQTFRIGFHIMKKKLKSDIFCTAFIIIFIIFLILLYMNFGKTNVLEKKKIYSKVIVGDKYGFDINGSALTFGMIVPGTSSSIREIILMNKYNRDVDVEIYSDGSIKNFLKVSKNNFILRANESVNIKFSASVPLDCERGLYDGNVTILIKKVNEYL